MLCGEPATSSIGKMYELVSNVNKAKAAFPSRFASFSHHIDFNRNFLPPRYEACAKAAAAG
jgi:hypothetical protein